MPINSTHKDYDKQAPLWQRCRDVIAGEDVIKGKGTTYLSKLTGDTTKEYEAFKNRALFYNAVARTKTGFLGAIFRKEPRIEYPDLDSLHNVTLKYSNITDFASSITNEVFAVGKVGVLVNYTEEQSAHFLIYNAESIINWQTKVFAAGEKLTLVVLKEVYADNSKDRYKYEYKDMIRVLELDEAGYYKSSLYMKDKDPSEEWQLIKEEYPQIRGFRIDYIPFKIIDFETPPLLDMVNISLKHYTQSADYAHGLHFTALPTAVVFGVTEEEQFKIGSTEAWLFSDPDGSASFLEFTGQGLQAIEKALDKKAEYMAILGSRMLEEPKKASESFDTHKLRGMAENATLAAISKEISKTVTSLLEMKAEAEALSQENILFTLNNDFIATTIQPDELNALVAAYQQGALSMDTLLYNLQKGEIIPEGTTIEEEKKLISEQVHLLTVE